MSFKLTLLYGGLLGLIYLILAARVMLWRFNSGVVVGDGGQTQSTALIRAHANFIEYVPLALIMFAILEYMTVGSQAPACSSESRLCWPPGIYHALGITLVIARLLHMMGMWQNVGISFGRRVGTALTMLVLTICVFMCMYAAYHLSVA